MCLAIAAGALAAYIICGNIPPEDETEAYIWYLERAKKTDSPKILNALGECYFWGRGTDVDYDNAFSCFERAAQRNNHDAQYNLGVCYAGGYGTEFNDEKALENFRLAENYHPDASAYIGYYYYRGWGGVDMDKNEAYERFALAQSKGSVMAIYFEALYYLGEEEQENHCERAAELCQQAIDAGYEKGYGLLGFCYYVDSPIHSEGAA